MPMSTAELRQQLSHEEFHLIKWLLGGCLALIAFWTSFHIDPAFQGLSLVCSVLTILLMARPGILARTPAFLKFASVPLIVTAFAADILLTREVLPALIRLSMLLLLFRCCTPRSRREDLQLVLLALFLVVVTGVLTVSLLFGFQIVLFMLFGMIFLFVVTFAEAMDFVQKPSLESWTQVPLRRTLARARHSVDGRITLLCSLGMVLLLGLSAVLFLSMPRIELSHQFDLLSRPSGGSSTGFSDRLDLSTVTNIREDETRVLRIEVEDPSLLPSTPYWKMVVLDAYEGGGFRESRGLQLMTREVMPGAPHGQMPAVPFTRFRFFLEQNAGDFVPTTGSYTGIVPGDGVGLRYNRISRALRITRKPPRMIGVQIDHMNTLPSVIEPIARIFQDGAEPVMIVPHENPFGRRLVLPADAGSGRSTYPLTTLELPLVQEDVDLLKSWVREIEGDTPLGALAFADAACRWLSERHGYSLTSRVVSSLDDSRDVVVRWIDGRGDGHCEYFASAFTLLARAAGHPARIVAGFKGGSWNRQDSENPYIAIRNSDAHAWAEIYDGNERWHLVEPTAGGTSGVQRNEASAARALNLESGFSAWMDSLRMAWYRRVVSFDSTSQQELLLQVRDALRDLGGDVRGRLQQAADWVKSWFSGPWDGVRLLRMGAFAAGVLSIAYLVFEIWRRRGIFLASAGRRLRMNALRGDAGRWLRRLDATGAEDAVANEVRAGLTRLRWGPPVRRDEGMRRLSDYRRTVKALERRS